MKKQSSRILHGLLAAVMLYLCLGLTTGRTIDEIIAGLSSSSRADFDFIGDVSDNVIRLELDMMLTVEQYLALYDKQSAATSKSMTRKKRKALNRLTSRWTNNVIPYKIDNTVFSSRDTDEINGAIKEWETHTCIQFKRATFRDSNFISFEDGSGCSSHVGMIGRKQSISLADGCRYKGVIAHEIGHAVGFFHEQNRPDRDDYIIIKKENIIHPDLYNNFQKYSWATVSTYDVPYDYTSIMHYGGRAFSASNEYTIVTRDPAYQEVIGNREGLSFNDIKLANLMYNCSQGCRSSIVCPKEGFLGKDCQCWCPGNPKKICERINVVTPRPTVRPITRPTYRPTTRPTYRPTPRPTYRPTVRPTSAICKDKNTNCPKWARSGFCQTSDYVISNCKASCPRCGSPSKVVTTCKDKDISVYCPLMKDLCSGMFSNYMNRNCPVTCGLCVVSVMSNSKNVNPYNSIASEPTNRNVSPYTSSLTENSGDVVSSCFFIILCGVVISFLRSS